MKVKELIELLSKKDSEMDVVITMNVNGMDYFKGLLLDEVTVSDEYVFLGSSD